VNKDLSAIDFIYLGVMRCIAGFPLEHPCEVLKLRNQALPSTSSFYIFKSIFLKSSFKGFYQGAVPNLMRRSVKEGYRWPTIKFFSDWWNKILPEAVKRDGTGTQIAIAASMATVETFLILPLERILLTKVNEQGYVNFYKSKIKKEGPIVLYRGLWVTFLRHLTVWTALMTTNYFVKEKIYSLDSSKNYPFLSILVGNLLIAANLTLWGLPLDFMRTNIQMNAELQQMRINQVAKILYRQHGIQGFYAGVVCVYLQKNIQALFGGALLDKATQSAKNLPSR
jgi:hypothetical protein